MQLVLSHAHARRPRAACTPNEPTIVWTPLTVLHALFLLGITHVGSVRPDVLNQALPFSYSFVFLFYVPKGLLDIISVFIIFKGCIRTR
jgi:hypothetical protein